MDIRTYVIKINNLVASPVSRSSLPLSRALRFPGFSKYKNNFGFDGYTYVPNKNEYFKIFPCLALSASPVSRSLSPSLPLDRDLFLLFSYFASFNIYFQVPIYSMQVKMYQ